MEHNNEDAPAWERHGQSVLTALILAGIMYIASQTINATTQIEIINVKLEVMTIALKDAAKDRYTALDAKNDLSLRDARIERYMTDIKVLEKNYTEVIRRLDKLEAK